MTIQDIKHLTRATEPEFFAPATLKAFGQTLQSFTVERQPDGRHKITAPRFNPDGSPDGETIRYYNPTGHTLDTR